MSKAEDAKSPFDDGPRPRFEVVEGEKPSVKVYLSAPAKTSRSDEVTELVIRQPKGGDYEIMGEGGDNRIKGLNLMLAALAGVPVATIRNLPSPDWQKVTEALGELGFQQP